MMNLFKLSEQLKDLSKDQLVQEMKMPSGSVPQFLVMSELQRRSRMEREAMTAEPAEQTTVAQDTVAAAGAPQGGLAQMAQALAPKTDMAENTGIAAMAPQAAPQRMNDGGVVRMQEGGEVEGPNTARLRQLIELQRALGTANDQTRISLNRLDPDRPRLTDVPRELAPNAGYPALPRPDTAPSVLDVDPTLPLSRSSEGLNTARLRSLIDLQRALEEARVQTDVNRQRILRASEPSIADVEPRVSDVTPTPGSWFENWQSLPSRPVSRERFLDALGPGAEIVGPPIDTADPRVGIAQVDRRLAEPGLSENERAALESRRAALVQTWDTAQAGEEAVADAYTLFGRTVGAATDLAGTGISTISPRAGAAVMDFADAISEGADFAEEGFVPGRPGDLDRYEPEPASIPLSGRPDVLEDMSDAAAPPPRDVEEPEEPGGPGGPGDGTGGDTDLDRLYEQDRWMALARFGLGLMSSREPTLGGAIGEAGANALDYMAGARESMMDRRMQEAELDLARQRLALAAAGGGNTPQIPASGVGLLDEQIQGLTDRLTSVTQPPTPAERDLLTTQLERLTAQRDALRMRYFAQFPGALEMYLGAGSTGGIPGVDADISD